jgi:hypothetical protein
MVSVRISQRMGATRSFIERLFIKTERPGSMVTQIVIQYKKGPRTKAERTERRDELITQAIDVGMREPEEIFEFIKGQDPDLVRNGKRFIDPQIHDEELWEKAARQRPTAPWSCTAELACAHAGDSSKH